MRKALKFCAHEGCKNLTREKYCEAHQGDAEAERKRWAGGHKRGTATERGYDGRWAKYAKWFLRQEGNQFCVLHLDDGCAIVAQCVDHIVQPDSKDDPLFWDMSNHQPACIHCNSVKGHKTIKGTYVFGEDYERKVAETDNDYRQQGKQED